MEEENPYEFSCELEEVTIKFRNSTEVVEKRAYGVRLQQKVISQNKVILTIAEGESSEPLVFVQNSRCNHL